MKLYDACTDAVKQGGTRRGANMGILRVDHPDILEFISLQGRPHAGDELQHLGGRHAQVHGRGASADTSYDLVDPSNGRWSAQLDANMVWDKMILGAWRTGEPGVFFIDEANRYNPVPHLGAYEATNPCGEQPLLAYDVCNLGSINVGIYVQGRRDGLGRAARATSI